jgi:hypothetical protein
MARIAKFRQQPQQRKLVFPPFPKYQKDDHKKIALIQPGSWGDNINSTLMFRPLKKHWPGAILDVYTSSIYSSAFHNNPDIDHLMVVEVLNRDQALHLLTLLPKELEGRGYDVVLNPHPMINGDKWVSIRNGHLTGPHGNLIGAWIRALEDLNVNYDLPLETVLVLTQAEIDKVQNFMRTVPPGRNVLMEDETRSGQSFWNGDWTMAVAKRLLNGQTNLFLSRQQIDPNVEQLQREHPGRVFFMGDFSIRECADVFNYCDIFFSVSSGLSNACNTSWCKKNGIWIETVNPHPHGGSVVTSAPIRSEGKTFWFDNNLQNFLEMLRARGI